MTDIRGFFHRNANKKRKVSDKDGPSTADSQVDKLLKTGPSAEKTPNTIIWNFECLFKICYIVILSFLLLTVNRACTYYLIMHFTINIEFKLLLISIGKSWEISLILFKKSGGLCPLTPRQGLCPWTPLGAAPPDPCRSSLGSASRHLTCTKARSAALRATSLAVYCSPLQKILGTPLNKSVKIGRNIGIKYSHKTRN